MATMAEDRPTNHSILTDDSMTKLRSVLIRGVQYLVEAIHARGREKPLLYNFHDIEVAVSTERLTSTNCGPLLEVNELAHLLRFNELLDPENKATNKLTPRSILFGVVMTHTSEVKTPVRRRLWEAYTPVWTGSPALLDITSKDTLIGEIKEMILDSVLRACKEASGESSMAIDQESVKFPFSNNDARRIKED